MDNNKLIGRTFSQKTTGTRDKDGFWNLHVITTETVTYPDGTSKEESIESSCLDRDFDVAHQIALHSVISALQDLVYGRGFDSLIEGNEYQRKLEEMNNDLVKADEDTPTE